MIPETTEYRIAKLAWENAIEKTLTRAVHLTDAATKLKALAPSV
jgi:hypothetical protein